MPVVVIIQLVKVTTACRSLDLKWYQQPVAAELLRTCHTVLLSISEDLVHIISKMIMGHFFLSPHNCTSYKRSLFTVSLSTERMVSDFFTSFSLFFCFHTILQSRLPLKGFLISHFLLEGGKQEAGREGREKIDFRRTLLPQQEPQINHFLNQCIGSGCGNGLL